MKPVYYANASDPVGKVRFYKCPICSDGERLRKLLKVVHAVKAERRAIILAEAGKTRGFDIADAGEAVDKALAALESEP